jgi:hypothetical protein
MSGPITRQYGVPNWDEIFGKKDDSEANAKTTEADKVEEASKDAPKDQADESKEQSASI